MQERFPFRIQQIIKKVDIDKREVWWQHSFKNQFGYNFKNHTTPLSFWLDSIHPEDRPQILKAIESIREQNGQIWDEEYRLIKKNGVYDWIIDRGFISVNPDGRTQIVGTMLNKTMTDNIQHRLAVLQKEKDILTRELHHRVKNNLALVISMLELQKDYGLSEKFNQALIDCQTRIYSIATIHEELYQNEMLSEIDVKNQLLKLMESQRQRYGQTQHSVDVEIPEVFNLTIRQAVPLMLLINELLSNALKHAFEEREDGTIQIALRKEEDRVSFEIIDNGKGMSKNPLETNTDTLGYLLIKNLIKQLDAEYDIKIEDGVSFSIKFIREPLPLG